MMTVRHVKTIPKKTITATHPIIKRLIYSRALQHTSIIGSSLPMPAQKQSLHTSSWSRWFSYWWEWRDEGLRGRHVECGNKGRVELWGDVAKLSVLIESKLRDTMKNTVCQNERGRAELRLLGIT